MASYHALDFVRGDPFASRPRRRRKFPRQLGGDFQQRVVLFFCFHFILLSLVIIPCPLPPLARGMCVHGPGVYFVISFIILPVLSVLLFHRPALFAHPLADAIAFMFVGQEPLEIPDRRVSRYCDGQI